MSGICREFGIPTDFAHITSPASPEPDLAAKIMGEAPEAKRLQRQRERAGYYYQSDGSVLSVSEARSRWTDDPESGDDTSDRIDPYRIFYDEDEGRSSDRDED